MSRTQAGTAGTPRRHEIGIQRVELAALAVLYVVAFALRWSMSDGDFYGDEAWYFYLAHDFGRESGAQAEHPWFHIANRPLFYAFFHLSTQAGLYGFRLLGACVGACIPLLAHGCARACGASRTSAAIAAFALCLQPVLLRYSANVFPDTLAACFALSACWAAARGSARWTLLFCLACVWSKESFVCVPVIASWLRLYGSGRPGRRRPDAWALFTCGIPVAYLATITLLSLNTEGVRLQGWSSSPLTLSAARDMLVGPEVWPWLLWLAWWREARILVLWLGLPAFYLVWTHVLGRGMEEWYAVGPVTLSCVAAGLGLDALRRLEPWRNARVLRWLAIGAAVWSLSVGVFHGLRLVRERTAALAGRWPQPAAAAEVVAILERLRPSRVVVLNCFWAYRYSHLRGRAEPGIAAWWRNRSDTEQVLSDARAADLVVVCRDSGHEEIHGVLKRHASDTLLETARWLVVRLPRRS